MAFLTVVLSAIVAFGVASYTARHDDRAARRTALAPGYSRVLATATDAITCTFGACTRAEARRLRRQLLRDGLAIQVRGSAKVVRAVNRLSNGELVACLRSVEDGRDPSDRTQRRAFYAYYSLQRQIGRELAP